MPNLRRVVPDVSVVEYLKTARPGSRVLVWYEDDDVWHERLLLWPCGGYGSGWWIICTPDHLHDEGVYAELLEEGEDIQEIRLCAADGSRPVLNERVYSFGESFDDAEFVRMLERAKPMAVAEASEHQRAIQPPEEFISFGSGFVRALPGHLGPRPGIMRRPAGSRPVVPEPLGGSAMVPSEAPRHPTEVADFGSPARAPPDALSVVGRTPEGFRWMVSEVGNSDYPIGSAVRLTGRSWFRAGRGVFVPFTGGPVSVELVSHADAPEFVRLKYQLLRGLMRRDDAGLTDAESVAGSAADGAGVGAVGRGSGGAPPAPIVDDVRTLAVTYDSQGSRWKMFRDCVVELTEDTFPDFPLEDPRSVLWLMKYIARQGQTPITWVESYLQRKRYAATDRAQHELRFLAEYLEYTMCYDQLNASSLAGAELVARRWAIIISAHDRDPLKPDYSGSELFMGLGTESDGLAPGLMKNVARKLKDQAEVQRHRDSRRGLPGAGDAPHGATPNTAKGAGKGAKGGAGDG